MAHRCPTGIVAGIEDGWFIGMIADAADQQQRDLDTGVRKVVGVNVHRSTITEPLEVLHISDDVERAQTVALAQRKAARDAARVADCLSDLATAASGTGNLIPPMLDAMRAEATVGEVCATLRSVFGEYREPAIY